MQVHETAIENIHIKNDDTTAATILCPRQLGHLPSIPRGVKAAFTTVFFIIYIFYKFDNRIELDSNKNICILVCVQSVSKAQIIQNNM